MLCPRENYANSLQPTPAKIDKNRGAPFQCEIRGFAGAGNGLRLQIHLAQQGGVARVRAQGIKPYCLSKTRVPRNVWALWVMPFPPKSASCRPGKQQSAPFQLLFHLSSLHAGYCWRQFSMTNPHPNMESLLWGNTCHPMLLETLNGMPRLQYQSHGPCGPRGPIQRLVPFDDPQIRAFILGHPGEPS